MFLSSPRTSVEEHYARLTKLIPNLWIGMKDKRYLEFRNRLDTIIKYLDYYLSKYEKTTHPSKLSIIHNLKSLFIKMINANDKSQIQETDTFVKRGFSMLNEMCSSYVVRHPEKANAEQISAASGSGRELSFEGVKQAKEFSERIIDEVLLTKGGVVVFLEFSYYKRTELFARIIEKKLQWAASKYNKRIKVVTSRANFLSGDIVSVPKGQGLEEWVQSSNALVTARSVYAWFSSRHPGNPEFYVINIGITHLPHLTAFLFRQLGIPPERAISVNYADFIKFESRGFNYEGKWY